MQKRTFLIGLLQASISAGIGKAQTPLNQGLVANNVNSVTAAEFGIYPSDTLDQTDAMMRAHLTGRVIRYPAGNYNFSRLKVHGGGIIGQGVSTVFNLQGSPTTGATIEWLGPKSGPANPPVFRNFSLIAPTPSHSIAETAISFPLPLRPRDALYGIFERLEIRNFNTCLDLRNLASFTVDDCQFMLFSGNAIVIGNERNPDVGDGCISNCLFFCVRGASALATGILQYSGGGARIVGNKFNACAKAYSLDVRGQSSILIFNSNSVENSTETGLTFRNSASTQRIPVRFDQFVISGNQFAGNFQDINFLEVNEYKNSSYWDGIVITGNVFVRRSGDKEASVVLNTARDSVVANNAFFSAGGRGASVLVAPSCINVTVNNTVGKPLS